MGVFTFVCRSKGGEWSAKQLEGEIESSAASTYELQRKLVQAATFRHHQQMVMELL
ncbi:hypothetical protein ES332_A05G004100v1 [Gossypium tomentosum]|uniref:Uncharacterized protein n=1 Tax=Gossypium tomentosum TaxID=34277 RepID=A0A5D2Q8P9_GOSTO|nr:hypothetical protein ES332_A05G004100v1 [Gossypium tomentosum]